MQGPGESSPSAGKGKFLRRFDGRAEDYSNFRPKYPPRVLEILKAEIGFTGDWMVADIGSGTGILSQLFLENGNVVFCVEPNDDMKKAAEANLGEHLPRFISVRGRAEATGLGAGSVDLLVVGQALHWFDPELARAEFARILKKPGYLMVVDNARQKKGKVEEAYSRIVDEFAKDRAVVPPMDDDLLAKYFETKKSFLMPNEQSLDYRGMLGRISSASYMPRRGSPEWGRIEEEVQKLMEDFGEDGLAVLHYETFMDLGKVRQE